MFKAEFLYCDSPGASHAHCACIVQAPDDRLLAAWYVYPEEETKGAQLVISTKEGPDGTWPYAKPIDLGVTSSLANPIIYFDPSGTLWLHFVSIKGSYWDTAQWCAARSDDLGHSFSRPSAVSPEKGLMVRHPPIFLPSGKGLLPIYSDRTKRSFLFESDPPYGHWSELYDFGDEPIIQPSLISLKDKLAIFFRPAENPRYTWRSLSSDEGKTWSAPVRLPLPNPLSGISAIALGNRAGLIYNNTTKHQRFPLSIAWSDPNLQTWTDPTDLDSPGFEVSYPSFMTDQHDVVHGVYTYNRKFIKYISFDRDWIEDGNAQD